MQITSRRLEALLLTPAVLSSFPFPQEEVKHLHGFWEKSHDKYSTCILHKIKSFSPVNQFLHFRVVHRNMTDLCFYVFLHPNLLLKKTVAVKSVTSRFRSVHMHIKLHANIRHFSEHPEIIWEEMSTGEFLGS